MNEKRIIYMAGKYDCEYCGISSFNHIHEPNTLPKDFKIPKVESSSLSEDNEL